MVGHCLPVVASVCTDLHQERGQKPAELRLPGPAQVAEAPRVARASQRAANPYGLRPFDLRRSACEYPRRDSNAEPSASEADALSS